MKYFTDELLVKFNSESAEEREQADLEWLRNSADYSAVFETIKGRFSKKFLKTYSNYEHFHDFKLIGIVVKHKRRGFINPISMDIIIEGSQHRFRISYKSIRKLSINFEEIDDDFMRRRGFDDWGYSEFLPVGEQFLSQEILFASGASVLIHFKNGNVYINEIALEADLQVQ
jgi:hypothetical protein